MNVRRLKRTNLRLASSLANLDKKKRKGRGIVRKASIRSAERVRKPKVHDMEMKAGLEGRGRTPSAAAAELLRTFGREDSVVLVSILLAYQFAKINKAVPTFLKMLDQLVKDSLK